MRHKPLRLALSLLALASPAAARPHPVSVAEPVASRGAQQHPQRPTPAPSGHPAGQALVHPTGQTVPVVPPPQPVPQVPLPAGPVTADQVAQRIQGYYDRTTDFQADFVQVSRNRLYAREERRSGHVMFLKPGRMRWNYNQPSGDVIVSDGTTILAYQAEEHQALQQSLAQSQLPTALTFLAGTGRITDSFTFALLDANSFHFPNGYVLELRPLQPSPGYERIVFYVDRASYQVERTVVINAQGDQNRFDFIHPQVNLNPPQTTFRWTPPTGTNIIHP